MAESDSTDSAREDKRGIILKPGLFMNQQAVQSESRLHQTTLVDLVENHGLPVHEYAGKNWYDSDEIIASIKRAAAAKKAGQTRQKPAPKPPPRKKRKPM